MLYNTKYGFGVSVEIVRDDDTSTAQVKVHAPFYIRKEFFLEAWWCSKSFSDAEILCDSQYLKLMRQHFGPLDIK